MKIDLQIDKAHKDFDNIKKFVEKIYAENSREHYASFLDESISAHILNIFTCLLCCHQYVASEALFLRKFAKKYIAADPLSLHNSESIEKLTNRLLIETPGYILDIAHFDRQRKTNKCDTLTEMIINLCIEFASVDESYTQEESEFITNLRNALKSATDTWQETTFAAGSAKIEYEPPNTSPKIETVDEIISELDRLIGMSVVKKEVQTLVNVARVNELRRKRGLPIAPISNHLVFSGNPGTGKTTVARILARIYGKIGTLSKGHLIEVDRGALVAGYVGQTALKVKECVESALGGVLFIDEAYSLVRGGKDDFGKEAVDILVKLMEDNRKDLIVVVAGYTKLMEDFINANPGIKSRFNKYIEFTDYSSRELVFIFKKMASENGYTLKSSAEPILEQQFDYQQKHNPDTFGNARGARNFFEKAIEAQANRIVNISGVSDDELQLITEEDIDWKGENLP